MERSRVRDGQHVGSEADPVQVLLLTVELGNCHALDHAARLEEAVEFAAGCEAKQAAQFGTPQSAGAVLLQRERLERPAPQVGAGTEPGGEVVGDGDVDVHRGMLARPRSDGKSSMIKDVIKR